MTTQFDRQRSHFDRLDDYQLCNLLTYVLFTGDTHCYNFASQLTHSMYPYEFYKLMSECKYGTVFKLACESGYLQVAKHIVDLGVDVDKGYGFRYACANGHLNVAKWLHTLGVDIHSMNEEAFRWACSHGHLDVTKWLHSLGDVNIHVVEDLAFQWACVNGHLDVAKWLHSLGGVNIYADDYYIFRGDCDNRLPIIKWLYSISSEAHKRRILEIVGIDAVNEC